MFFVIMKKAQHPASAAPTPPNRQLPVEFEDCWLHLLPVRGIWETANAGDEGKRMVIWKAKDEV